MHACVHVCMYACICMHACICMYVCMHACMYVRMHVCKCVCMYVYMYVCTHVRMYACMYACMHACMHECMNVYMYVCEKGPSLTAKETCRTRLLTSITLMCLPKRECVCVSLSLSVTNLICYASNILRYVMYRDMDCVYACVRE